MWNQKKYWKCVIQVDIVLAFSQLESNLTSHHIYHSKINGEFPPTAAECRFQQTQITHKQEPTTYNTHTHLALFYLALKRDWQWREICFYLLVCQRPLFTRRKVSRFDGGTRYNQHAELVLAVQLLNSVWLKLAGIPSFCLWLVVTVD